MQNYSECLHCPTIHPELSTKLPYTSGANDLTEGAFLGGYMEIKAPNESATMSGRACALPLIALLPPPGSERVQYQLLEKWETGCAVQTIEEAAQTVEKLLKNPRRLTRMRENARVFGHHGRLFVDVRLSPFLAEKACYREGNESYS